MLEEVISTTIQYTQANQQRLAWADIIEGFKKYPIWVMLAYQDLRLRYRRSILGPFWLTLSMAITVYSMGFLYSRLFHVEIQKYFPFLVAGMLGWSLISTLIVELCEGFVTSDGFIRQIKMPYSLYIHRIVMRNIFIFFHNILVIFPVLILFHQYAKINFHTLLLVPGLIIIYINAFSYGLILAMTGARYRDISQIIRSLIQVIFFLTPVMWSPDILMTKKYYVVAFNPFYSFLEIIRAPLLGFAPSFNNCFMVMIITLFGLFMSFTIFKKYRSRIIYWL